MSLSEKCLKIRYPKFQCWNIIIPKKYCHFQGVTVQHGITHFQTYPYLPRRETNVGIRQIFLSTLQPIPWAPCPTVPNSSGCLTTLGVVGRCICPTKSSCTQRLRDTRAATASTESHDPRAMAWVFRRSVKRGQVGRQLERWTPGTGMAGKWGSSLAIKHGNAICPFTWWDTHLQLGKKGCYWGDIAMFDCRSCCFCNSKFASWAESA